ncbi:MAG: hypothetical protein HYR75_08950 [Gemmatimonadetes bacterium]|nr:hypothetical protein [Gemmatimonadota bacterium]
MDLMQFFDRSIKMRIARIVAALLLGSGLALPARAPAQSAPILRLGPELSLYAYSPETQGDWRTSLRQWTPVTVYDVDGRYYRKAKKGARPIVVYRQNGQYFLPPSDREWEGKDKRYNYKRQPDDEDRGRARNAEDNPGRGHGRGRGRGKP